jgi:hypothetical protein
MARLTITLTDDRHRALKEAAARRGRTIGELVEDSLDFYGIKARDAVTDLVARARARAALSEAQALELALAETRADRNQ